MSTTAMKNELLKQFNRLPIDRQRQVVQFARALERITHSGVPGSALISFAGSISPSDLHVISQAVEEDCERVDAHEW